MEKLSPILRELLSYLVIFAAAFLIVRGFYDLVAEPVKVDGRSMEYTLKDGERLMISKLSDIERFDIVIFPDPIASRRRVSLQETDPEKAAEIKVNLQVKRIIGVPGDTIEYNDGQLILNSQSMTEPYLQEKIAEYPQGFNRDFTLEDAAGLAVVPEGRYFVMGDNRRNSVDGRRYGFIDQEDVLGEASFRIWPLSEWGSLEDYELSEDGTEIVRK